MYNTISFSTKSTIAKLLKVNGCIKVKIKSVAKQSGSTDCGLYSIAYCVTLLENKDPCTVAYNQREMRSHLISCFQYKKIDSFPVVKHRRISRKEVSIETIEICPICQLAEDELFMVHCETCTSWFHQNCVPAFDEDNEEFDWVCPKCLSKDNKEDSN